MPADGHIPPKVVPIAVQAVAALAYDFGAVDIVTTDGVHGVDGAAFVLEVNTAPGLADPTLEWYAEQLGTMVGKSVDDMPKWDNGQYIRNANEDTNNG